MTVVSCDDHVSWCWSVNMTVVCITISHFWSVWLQKYTLLGYNWTKEWTKL